MWVRKSEDALARQGAVREAARASVWRPLLAAAVLTGGSLGLYAAGVRIVYGGVVATSDERAVDPVLFTAVGLMLFVGSLWYFKRRQRLVGGSPFDTGPKATICNRCHESNLEAVGGRCACGGKYEPLEDWEWVDEASETSTV